MYINKIRDIYIPPAALPIEEIRNNAVDSGYSLFAFNGAIYLIIPASVVKIGYVNTTIKLSDFMVQF